jgi:integrase/recombinase XerC
MDIPKTRAGSNYLTEAEEKKLFSTMRNRKENQAERDYVLLKTCRLLGLRRAEALSLNVGDIREKTQLLVDKRICRKNAEGELYLPMELQTIYRRFLLLKRRWGEKTFDHSPLFVSKKGNRLSLRAFNDVMTKWCAVAGIPPYTPHALRHTKGQRIMADIHILSQDEAAKKLLFANQQLRHKSMGSTLIYTTPTKEEMQKVGAI